MEKMLKKTGAALLILCLTISCFTLRAHAAEGTLQFSDPSSAAGENVTVTAKVLTGGAAIGDVDMTVTYDTSLLKFVSGTNVSGGDGTLKLSSKGDGNSGEAGFSMEFTALKEGTAKLQATEYTAYLYSDEALNLATGDSTVTIQGGTPVTGEDAEKDKKAGSGGKQVEIDGKTYTVNENFSEAAVPRGFTATDTELDGIPTKAMYQEVSGQYMYYLEDSEGKSDYFLYSTDDGLFTQTEVIDVNSDLSIYLMDHKDKEGLPSEYKETTTDIGGKVFTAWNNTSEKDYYLVYALSSEGTKGYYQYDSKEKTYQRYTVPVAEKKESTANTFTDKVMNFIEKHLTIIMCAAWGAFLLLLIIVIVLAVKLSHRNQELDELYDEYGLGEEDDDDAPHIKRKSREQFLRSDDSDDEDEYEDYDEDEYDDYYEESDEDDDYENYDDDFEDDEEYFDDDNEEMTKGSSKKSKKKKDDDFSMDFIDI